MKKVTLTEITEVELQQLIENSIRTVFSQELQKLANMSSLTRANSSVYLTRKQVIERIGLSYPTVVKLTKAGILKGKPMGGVYKYRESDLEKYFSERK